MVDQEPRHSDYLHLDTSTNPVRPGLFQATITGAGNISVYQNESLVGSLEQNTLVEEYHDVLWSGPVHDLLVNCLQGYLDDTAAETPPGISPADLHDELLMRWLNSICRILMSIQHYRHGGGLLITPQASLDGLNVKYKICYDRLLKSLRGAVECQLLTLSTNSRPAPIRACSSTFFPIREGAERRARAGRAQKRGAGVDSLHRLAVVRRWPGAARPAAGRARLWRRGPYPTTCSATFTWRDETRTPIPSGCVWRATQYGTRHRAMMRYCLRQPGGWGLSFRRMATFGP